MLIKETTAKKWGRTVSYKAGDKNISISESQGVVGNRNYYTRFGISHLLEIASNPKYTTVFEPGVGRGYYFVGVMSLPNMVFGRAVDTNPEAIELTNKNLEKNHVGKSTDLRNLDYNSYMEIDFLVDLIYFDLPLIPLPNNLRLQKGLREMLDGGTKGDVHIRQMVVESPKHLRKNGSIFFVQPDFIDRGILDFMCENGFEPEVKASQRKYLSETSLTSYLKPYIEDKLNYKFHSGSKGDYFTIQAIHGIKR